ncbi:MAG: two-component system, OmpR family, response regulator [Paraburkholderia sp.]|jgi:hypothetical protein|nr:two-component system, OmpR family, response regulator [Paraburkholderia sp.]MEA3122628.1 two-component system, OmpR family, response regulator [Paraburkholderia sp.]
MRILIAEDDSILADGVVRLLRQSGYAVDHVRDGSGADAVLSMQAFDLLKLDRPAAHVRGRSSAPAARAQLEPANLVREGDGGGLRARETTDREMHRGTLTIDDNVFQAPPLPGTLVRISLPMLEPTPDLP